jgi:hypothetical protein
VDFGPEVVVCARVRVLAEDEHARQGGDAEPGDRFAQEEDGLDVHDGLGAGRRVKAEGARDAARVEQGVDDDALVLLAGFDDPELLEEGEFLARGLRRVHGQAAGRKPVVLSLAHGAQVAGTEEDEELVEVFLRIDGRVDAETRVAHVRRNLSGEAVAPVVEGRGVEVQAHWRVLVDDVDGHGAVVEQPGVEELQLEGQLLVAPHALLGGEADISPLIVGDVLQHLGDLPLVVLEGTRGEIPGHGHDVFKSERGGLGLGLGGQHKKKKSGRKAERFESLEHSSFSLR